MANPDEGDWLRKEKEEEVVEKEEGVSKLVPTTQGGICAGPGETAWEKSAPLLKCTHTHVHKIGPGKKSYVATYRNSHVRKRPQIFRRGRI